MRVNHKPTLLQRLDVLDDVRDFVVLHPKRCRHQPRREAFHHLGVRGFFIDSVMYSSFTVAAVPSVRASWLP